MKSRFRQTGDLLRLVNTALVLAAIVVVAVIIYKVSRTRVEVGTEDRIEVTPTQITSMKAIGQWEFLSVADEELVDTVRKHIFGDDELVRIYYGTLRLGIDMSRVEDGWIEQRSDSIIVTLPPIALLDENFIDEARTESFYESGTWSERDMEALYHRAHASMKKRCLTRSNLQSAEDNAVRQFHQLMRTLGHENVIVRIRKR